MKLVGWEQLAAQGVPRWQVHKRVAGGSQRRGSVASPVMIGSSRKCAGNHPLSAGSPRQGATHRLCTRGGMLESFLQEPERLTDDDVMLLLKLIFHRQDTQELLKKMLEREKPETP